MLINKGYTQINSPYFFNKENIDVNSIPTAQTYLKDETGVSWLVAYLPKTTQTIKDEAGNINAWYDKSVEFSTSKPVANMSFATLDDVRYVANNGKEIIGGKDLGDTRPTLKYYIKPSKYDLYLVSLDLLAGEIISETEVDPSHAVNYLETDGMKKLNSTQIRSLYSALVKDLGGISLATYNSIYSKYNKKTVHIASEDKYYKITVNKTVQDKKKTYLPSTTSNVGLELKNGLSGTYLMSYAHAAAAEYTSLSVSIEFEEITTENYSFYYKSSRNPTADAAYDIIAVPYKDENNESFDGADPQMYLNFMTQLSAS